jgi:hypothetical protein
MDVWCPESLMQMLLLMTTQSDSNPYCSDTFSRLIKRANSVAPLQGRERWLLLEAAHIVGQTRFGPHLQVHWSMLLLAIEERTLSEVLGQAFRIALVPFGHLLGRLPLGNPGRANTSAFQSMKPSAEISETIAAARTGRF